MSEISTKPYLIRAIHQWCTDSGYTPYIAVLADDTVRVPRDFVKNGEIVLNISPLATSRLQLGNETIEFQARFGGVAREVMVRKRPGHGLRGAARGGSGRSRAA